jgi:NAD(P)-dependent dehydrogenase (short-subunit alcohol dehydrogenase family)
MLGEDGAQFFDNLIPLAPHASPNEIARSVLQRASDQSSFTTASKLVVDNGMSA